MAELFHARDQGLIGIQGWPPADEPAESFWLSPLPRPTEKTFDAAEIMRVYPTLVSAAEWMDEAITRYLTPDTVDAELNALIRLEANHADWVRFVELTASISSTVNDLAPEEIARAPLASDLAVWVPEIQPILHEMQEIKRRMADRLAKTTRASRLKAKILGATEPKPPPAPDGQATLPGGAGPLEQLTNEEFGNRLGCSPAAARALARRRGLPRVRGSDGKSRVTVDFQKLHYRSRSTPSDHHTAGHPDDHPDDHSVAKSEVASETETPVQAPALESDAAGAATKKQTKSRGPVPGTVNRFGAADQELFPEIRRLMGEGLSLTAATQELAFSGRVSGRGAPKSRAQRLARHFKAER
jgi:hypothetical protein